MQGVASTTGGLLRGEQTCLGWVFRGIPYAHAGGPDARWREAAPVPPWKGVRDAVEWGPIAPQTSPVPGFSLPGDPTRWDEDCLSLNVWTPSLDDARRPVMVWVHGGGFTTGTGASTLFEGVHLASHGVVVVGLNYRLGALGLLAHPDLGDPRAGAWANWALRDQVAALQWIKDNIASFGGDPDNVTLFGESAGAMSIADLLAVPRAAGLFHRVVLQSGPPAAATPGWATSRAECFIEHLGMTHFDVAELRRTPAVQLVSATQRLAAEVPGEGELPVPLLPVVDGDFLPLFPGDAVIDGEAAPVPLLVGTTRDESALFTVSDWTNPGLDMDGVIRRVSRFVQREAAQAVVEGYHDARVARGEAASPHNVWTAITTDFVFRLPLLSLLLAHRKFQSKVYSYLFTWESPFMGGAFGSCHGLEIPFDFGTVDNPAIQVFTGNGPRVSTLSDAMQHAWVAFARGDDPSCDEVGAWLPYDPVRRSTMVFGPETGLEDDPRGAERSIWDEAGVTVPIGHNHL